MQKTVQVSIPLNRVEGDLMIRVELEDGVVKDAWSSGTGYRGFEKLMQGRGVMDGLVITPRVCGICSTAHLTAACLALENMAGAVVPDNAIRIRNVALMVEQMQSDMRHGVLTFFADFTNPVYAKHPLYEEAVRRFTPLKGESVIEAVRQTRKLIGINAILGGQWPHSSFMVPGGIASAPSRPDLLQCRLILSTYKKWYEERILGCSVERWAEIKNAEDLEAWVEEKEQHRNSDLGFYLRFLRETDLSRIGRGCGNYLSFGAIPLPVETAVRSGRGPKLIPAGMIRSGTRSDLNEQRIAEDISHSWYIDTQKESRHPLDEETLAYASGNEGVKYSWMKAPRYDGQPAETGPLAELILQEHPLIVDLVRDSGASVYSRQLARLIRSTRLFEPMDTWLKETIDAWGDFYHAPGPMVEGTGFGLTEATRGALGHWVRAEDGRIAQYQIISPTSWNGSPRDEKGTRGPWEQALVGTAVSDVDNPCNVGHVIRSFDACIVCSVHVLRNGGPLSCVRI